MLTRDLDVPLGAGVDEVGLDTDMLIYVQGTSAGTKVARQIIPVDGTRAVDETATERERALRG